MAVPNIFGTATSAIPLSQLDQNFATAITLGNTAVYLGNTTTSLGNVTLTNVTISSGNVTVTSPAIFPAGTAAAPSITTTGDTNTGIFFPAADTIAFSEGGVEAARFDSAGNFGLGVTPSAWTSAWRALQIGGGSQAGGLYGNAGGTTGQVGISQNWYFNGSNNLYLATAAASDYYQFGGQHVWRNAPSGTAGNAISFTQAMTLDASGNLLLGGTTATNSASGRGNIVVNGTSSSMFNMTVGGVSKAYLFHAGTDMVLDNVANGAMLFYTNDTERARIDSDGRLLVGLTSSVASGYKLQIANGTGGGIVSTADNGGDANYWSRSDNIGYHFYASTVAGAGRFAVATNGNVTNANNSYGGISDVKLKENIIDATPKLEKLGQVRVVNFNFIGDQQKQIGVIAQELEQIFPSMIDESSDRDAEGNDLGTTTKSVKYSVFVPMLIKAIQEQQAIITQLTARITALEGA